MAKIKPQEEEQVVGNAELYLELIKIKLGVYAILGVIFVWGVSMIFLKLTGVFFGAIELLPIYIRVPWALAFGFLVFVWIVSFRSNSSDSSELTKTPNGVERDAG